MKTFARTALAFLVVTLSACASKQHYLIESKYVADQSEPVPNVTKTRSYSKLVSQIDTIAVKAPDSCVTETEAQKTGRASNSSTSMLTHCGVNMAHIERELAKAGFNVISWAELKSAVEVARQNEHAVTPMTAATRLDADALFQINSLEGTRTSAGRDARWETRFYNSDAYGTKKEIARVREDVAKQLRDYADGRLNEAPTRPSATINASVTYNNGQAIWFYDWTNVQELGGRAAVQKNYMACEEGWCRQFTKVTEEEEEIHYTSGHSRAVSHELSANDQRKAVENRLMEELIADMVGRFSSGN